MSDRSPIEWTEATWNPLRGCSEVHVAPTPGDLNECLNCYAKGVAARFSEPGMTYEGLARFSAKRRLPQWTGKVRFVEEKLDEPLHWRRPRRVFVNSMSDLFHEEVPFDVIAAIFGVMAAAPQHTFQTLTKRAGRMREWFKWMESYRHGARLLKPAELAIQCAAEWLGKVRTIEGEKGLAIELGWLGHLRDARDGHVPWPLPNVWLGVSAGHQAAADERIPFLLECPAAVRWVSYEPALGPIDFSSWLPLRSGDSKGPYCGVGRALVNRRVGLDWIVIGGESGRRARPFDVAWARSLIEQVRGTDCRIFVKQLGADVRTRNDDNFTDDGEPDCWPLEIVEADRIEENLSGHADGYQGAPVRIHLRSRKGGDPNEWPPEMRVREYPEVTRG